MHKFFRLMLIVTPVVLTSSCVSATDKTLSPPSDTKWINLEIKNPSQYTKPFPLEVVYISHKCTRERINGFDGSVITEPSYNGIKIPLTQSRDDLWRAKIALSGGGACDWTLSEFNLGIEYIDATHLGKDLVPGTAIGATIAFDDDATKNGQFDDVEGNVINYSPKYYPFVIRWSKQKQTGELDKLYLFGEKSTFWKVRLNVNGDGMVKYEPSIDETKVTEMFFPYDKGKSKMYTFLYPNGEKVLSKDIKPDFIKVERMTVK